MNTSPKSRSVPPPATASGTFAKVEIPSVPPPGHQFVPLSLLERLSRDTEAPPGHVALPVEVVEIFLDYISEKGRVSDNHLPSESTHMSSRTKTKIHRDPKILEKNRSAVLTAIRRNPTGLGISALEERTGVARNYLVQDLEALRDQGLIKKRGERRDASYVGA